MAWWGGPVRADSEVIVPLYRRAQPFGQRGVRKMSGIPKDRAESSCRPSAFPSGESDATGQKMGITIVDRLHTFPNSGIVIL